PRRRCPLEASPCGAPRPAGALGPPLPVPSPPAWTLAPRDAVLAWAARLVASGWAEAPGRAGAVRWIGGRRGAVVPARLGLGRGRPLAPSPREAPGPPGARAASLRGGRGRPGGGGRSGGWEGGAGPLSRPGGGGSGGGGAENARGPGPRGGSGASGRGGSGG